MQKYISDTLEKGLLNMDLISETLETLKARSFHHQVESQKEDVKFDRYDIDVEEFKLRVVDPTANIIRKRFIAYVEFDMISRNRKIVYRRSKLYRKEVSIFDIKDNPDIFDYNFLAFLDGKLVDFIHVIPSDTGTTVVFNKENGVDRYGLSVQQMNDMIKQGKTLTLFFLPNNDFGAYTTDIETLRKRSNLLSLKDTGIVDHLGDGASYLSFINSNGMGFKSVMLNAERSGDLLKFYDISEDKAHLNVFGFKYLYKRVDLFRNQKFVVDETKMPIAPENIILFYINPDGSHSFAHNIGIRHQYPNIYHLDGRDMTRDVVALIFYNKLMEDYLPEYNNDLEVYFKIKGYDNIHPLAVDYSPIKMDYSIEDYEKSEYYPNYNAYKLAKFTEWYRFNLEYARDYLKKKLLGSSGFYIKVKDIDLSDRIRYNNHDEISDKLQQQEFNEPRYVFILKNEEPGVLKARIYIDGLIYYPDHVYKRGIYEHYYIPQDYISYESIIEFETFKTHKEVVSFNTTSSNTAPVHFNNKIQVNSRDIFLTDSNNNIIDRDLYYFTIVDKSGNYIDLSESTIDLAYIDRVFVKIDDSLKNKSLKLNVYKSFAKYKFEYNEFGVNSTFNIKGDINPATDRIFMYYKRRLIPPSMYQITRLGTTKESDYMLYVEGLSLKEGDELCVYVIPNSYKTIKELQSVPENSVIDLRDEIDIPFDVQWYDTFLNGRLLVKESLKKISSRIVALNNVKSDRNVLILSRNDYKHGLYYDGNQSIMDKLFDEDMSFRDIIGVLYGAIEVTEDDFLKEIIYSELADMIRFFEEEMLGRIGHINPDELQITELMAMRYPKMITSEEFPHWDGEDIKFVHINPDINVETAEEVLHIKPEINEE